MDGSHRSPELTRKLGVSVIKTTNQTNDDTIHMVVRKQRKKLLCKAFVKIVTITRQLMGIYTFPTVRQTLDGDVPRRPSYGVYISQLIRFARVCSHVDDFNTRNKCLTAKLLKQSYRYQKLLSKKGLF